LRSSGGGDGFGATCDSLDAKASVRYQFSWPTVVRRVPQRRRCAESGRGGIAVIREGLGSGAAYFNRLSVPGMTT
jgi:hypothetical protein